MQASPQPSGRRAAHARGAYGLRVEGLDDADDLLLPVDGDRPTLTVRWIEETRELEEGAGEDAESSTVSFGEDVALVRHGALGTIEVRRTPAVATFRIRGARDPQTLVHPYLGGAASIVSRWLGREAFHGGAFVHRAKAWIVLGSRTAGKSSLLAWLHAHGVAIVADDVVVVGEGVAHAAPRSLDLRRESAERLSLGEPLGRVGARDRWRVRLGAVPLETTVGGFVFLSWDDDVRIREVRGAPRLAQLMSALTIPDRPADPGALLGLATLPCLAFGRRRDWDTLGDAGISLLGALDL